MNLNELILDPDRRVEGLQLRFRSSGSAGHAFLEIPARLLKIDQEKLPGCKSRSDFRRTS